MLKIYINNLINHVNVVCPIISFFMELWVILDSTLFLIFDKLNLISKNLYIFSILISLMEIIVSCVNNNLLLKFRRSIFFSLMLGYGTYKLFIESWSGFSTCIVMLIVIILIDTLEQSKKWLK